MNVEVMCMYKLLIADDEPKLAESVCDYFSAKGWRVFSASDGPGAVEAAASVMPDLLLLDVLMPGMDGFSACREIRAFCDAPVIFLTALGEEENYLSGYGAGADDYVQKPCSFAVLAEKCRAIIARARGMRAGGALSAAGVTLDPAKMTVTAGGTETALTAKECRLLLCLMRNKNTVLSREALLDSVWGFGAAVEPRAVDAQVKLLRKKLGKRARAIRTVIGAGYVFQEDRV